MDLKVRHIDKRFKNQTVLEDISFDVGSRELVSIVGPSGVGKTTLLQCIMGLLQVRSGSIEFGDVELTTQDAELFELARRLL